MIGDSKNKSGYGNNKEKPLTSQHLMTESNAGLYFLSLLELLAHCKTRKSENIVLVYHSIQFEVRERLATKRQLTYRTK